MYLVNHYLYDSNTGGTFFGHPDSAIKSIICHFQQLDLPHEVLSAKEANSRYKFLNLPNNFICVVDKSAGILAADRAVKTLQVSVAFYISYIISYIF